jgi:hypothetical protein
LGVALPEDAITPAGDAVFLARIVLLATLIVFVGGWEVELSFSIVSVELVLKL